MSALPLVGGIEAGGTKFVCAVGTGPDDLRSETRIPTTTPGETIGRAVAFLREQQLAHGPLAALGIASFGPVDPAPGSPTFGYITSTPKPGWANTDLAGAVSRELGVPVGFDTDVNGAGLGEWCHGAARGLRDFVYLTVGTGIGGGGMTNGRLMHGLIHPEMGHVRIPRDPSADPYPGCCPFHGDCLEGLASGPALLGRWGRPAEELGPDHEAWPLEARYLALALTNYVCTLSPQRIIVGGGVMSQPGLLSLVRKELQRLLADYVRAPAILEEIDSYVVAPGLGHRAGLVGALALAHHRLEHGGSEPPSAGPPG